MTELQAGPLSATVLPELGMVVSSLRSGEQEVLGQRGGVEAYREHGSTFGIPLLYPWANRLSGWDYTFGDRHVVLEPGNPLVHIDAATGNPMHGLLAASPHWAVVSATTEEVVAELDWAAVPEYMACFPFPHRLTMRVALSETALSVQLTVTATGEEYVPISFGFHPYLAIPGLDRADWLVEMPVDGGMHNGRLRDAAFDASFDDLAGHPPVFTVSDLGLRLSVSFTRGYRIAQVYSPAEEQFICFEPMTAPVDALRSGRGLRAVSPGASFSAEFSVGVV
jgi:galactose mutarotase-like enzyme